MTKFNDVAQFDQSAVAGAMVEFVPARVYVTGGTNVEKRVAVASTASREASMFLISQGGKVGKAAAMNIVADGLASVARAARNGNYKPLAEALACINAESVCITSRASFESLGDRFDAKLNDIQESKTKGLTSSGKESPKLKAVYQSLMLINGVYDAIAAINAHAD